MEHEPQHDREVLTAIHIDLIEQAVEFEDRHGTVDRMPFIDGKVVADGAVLWSSSARSPDADPLAPSSPGATPDDRGLPRP